MVIQTNVSALISCRESAKTNRAMKKTLEKLSSGYRINRSADDASGLAVSERMRFYCTEYGRCHTNAKEGLNLAKTADGALAEVNDMLRRARELCIQAENGTYSEQELASISDEMNELFSEIDRITEGSFFNEIQLFRGEQGPDFHYEYDETFIPVDGGGLESWGEMDFVNTSYFDDPPQAKAATATFKLDDGVKFDDVSSMNGRAITAGGHTYYFSDGTVNTPSDYYSHTIDLNTYSSTESALNEFARLARLYSGAASVEIDKDARTVTMSARLNTKDDGSFDAMVDGSIKKVPNKDPQGNGAWANGNTAAQNISGTPSLDQVDGQGITNNRPTYSTTATGSFSLAGFPDTLTQYYVDNLKGNTLKLPGSKEIAFSSLSPSVGMSRDNFGTKLATAISNLGANYEATYDSATKRVSITLKNQPATSGSAGSISEDTTDPKTHSDEQTMFTSSGLSLSAKVTSPPSAESSEVCEVTVPATTAPFAFSVNGTNYLYYDSSKNSLKRPEDKYTSYSSYVSSYNVIDVNGMSRNDIVKNIAQKLRGLTSGGVAEVNGDKITLTSGSLNSSMGVGSKLSPATITVTGGHTVTDKEGTDPVLGLGSSTYFYKTATVTFDLGAEADISKLAGKGFSISDSPDYNDQRDFSDKWEFTNGAGIHSEYGDIDISGCITFDQLKDKVQQVMGMSYTVEIDKTDPDHTKLSISRSVRDLVEVKDGVAGIKNLISGDEPVKYSGGSDVGYSETQIDFSSVNSDNLNDLLGKGFRINCATCTGEYINVFFCWENNGRVPESFEIEVDGVKRTIPNISVELSKVTSADQIVQSIVDQVRPTLKHFTDVDVGSPPTTLIARDKRLGGAKVNDAFKPAEVVTGLNTNFNYSVNIRKVEEYPEDGSVAVKENIVDIYVGSEPDPQIIPIHLPYIDLKTLRLRPPETVDLNDAEQDASNWLNRVDQANLFISKSRGVIGADHNRLESAVQALSHAKENVTDAESRIRDTDMAEEMMEQVKLQILTQSQQSMLSQAMAQPQQVLRLIS